MVIELTAAGSASSTNESIPRPARRTNAGHEERLTELRAEIDKLRAQTPAGAVAG